MLNKFEDLVGQTLKEIAVTDDKEIMTFTLENGERYQLSHDQDCCECVRIEDICGELNALVGMPILLAEEATNDNHDSDDYYNCDSQTWTFYKLATNKGYATIRWLGESNGYYSESVDWNKVY